MREALLYKKLSQKKVQCETCPHFCTILPNTRGKCGVRENKNGRLFSLVYGKVIAINIDPIEKKPFFHFMPGSDSLSFGTAGCNFACLNCQNWQISQSPKTAKKIEGQEMLPEKIVETAIHYRCPSISYTYTEPTVFFEFALDTMKLAKRRGLKNCWVSNGFTSKKTLELVIPYLDAINVDIKNSSEKFYKEYCKARLGPVIDTLLILKKKGVWIEVTTLVIPKAVNENVFTKIANFIKKELGEETPWHISRFFPEISWKLRHLYSTPIDLVQKGCDIGMAAGLKYVYGGNTPGLASEDTYCPKCRKKMIDRTGYSIERKDKNGDY
jgi:pyruvate formate lyase activating enzyme